MISDIERAHLDALSILITFIQKVGNSQNKELAREANSVLRRWDFARNPKNRSGLTQEKIWN
jgi:hypothetical protein